MKSKELKRLEAQERQARFDALTREEKWMQIVQRPGASWRESARLEKES